MGSVVPVLSQEQQRLAAVRRYNILDTPPEGTFDRVAALAARFFGAPLATVTVVDADCIWFKAVHGLDGISEIGRESGLCASAIRDEEPYVVTDALADLRTVGHPFVHGALGIRSYAGAPIITGDGFRLGTVNVLGYEAREVTAEEIATLQDLAAVVMDALELRLAAMGTIKDKRDARERSEPLVAALRQTLLPPQLPHVPGLDVASYYHTALEEEVGGDFYDLLETGEGRFVFFLGDVCGRGVAAAALTSLARYTLRAGALRHASPTQALEELNSAILMESGHDDGRFCTVVYGEAERADGGRADGGCARVTLARGGHPPVMIVRADGRVERITPPGTLVGALPDARFESASVTLRPGDALVLYTDGLTEAHLSPMDRYGEDRLAEHLSKTSGQPAPAVVSVLRELLEGFDPGINDDVALLAISVPPTKDCSDRK